MKYRYIAGILLIFLVGCSGQGQYDTFAQCLTDSGTTFYGAFWCPYCNEQKKMFGKSMQNIAYVECSTPDKKSQTKACQDADIKNYPTWEFGDGKRQEGRLSILELSQLSGCSLT